MIWCRGRGRLNFERWEPWSNIYLNRDKSFISAIDYSQRTQVDAKILYRGRPLPQHPIDEPLRYLGVLVTLTLNFKFEKDKGNDRNEIAIGNSIKGAIPLLQHAQSSGQTWHCVRLPVQCRIGPLESGHPQNLMCSHKIGFQALRRRGVCRKWTTRFSG